MRKILFTVGAAVVAAGFAGDVSAQATANVNYEVTAINEMSLAGAPSLLKISTGTQMAGVTDATTLWSATTNQTGMVVKAQLVGTTANANGLPAGLTLTVDFAGTAGSGGAVTLSTTAAQVGSLTKQTVTDQVVTYKLSATPDAPIGTGVVDVSYTVVAGT